MESAQSSPLDVFDRYAKESQVTPATIKRWRPIVAKVQRKHRGFRTSPPNGRSRAFWTRIGTAWAHRDGQGFNLRLLALPVSGRLVVRANRESGE